MHLNILYSSIFTSLVMVSSVFAQQKAAPQAGGGWAGIIPMMLIMFAIIYFLMIRPEQKKQKDRQNMVNTLKKGDKVVTIGGIMGTIHNVKDTSVAIRIADNTVVDFTKVAIATVVKEASGEKTEKTTEETKEIKEKKK